MEVVVGRAGGNDRRGNAIGAGRLVAKCVPSRGFLCRPQVGAVVRVCVAVVAVPLDVLEMDMQVIAPGVVVDTHSRPRRDDCRQQREHDECAEARVRAAHDTQRSIHVPRTLSKRLLGVPRP